MMPAKLHLTVLSEHLELQPVSQGQIGLARAGLWLEIRGRVSDPRSCSSGATPDP